MKVDYKKLYLMLFNAATDAIRQIDNQNYGCARQRLVAAQQKAEEKYLLQGEKDPAAAE